MEEDYHKGSASQAEPPSLVTLTPSFSPSTRRLSSCFSQPRRPIKAAKQLAWFSLQGRLVNAQEASSAKTVGVVDGLGLKEAVAWELFSPIQRILIVAVVAVASLNSKKNKQIKQLNKSVQLRDQVLSSMQLKLDNLCEQLNYLKDQPEAATADVSTCKHCQQNKHQPNDLMVNSMLKLCNEPKMFSQSNTDEAEEPEERRMSDLSDWAPSVTSSVDIQLNTSATQQETYYLQRECEEKDATIKELASFLDSSEAFGSKRISELEDIIRRKNMIITKLKKDILVLEQKVVGLSRLRRPSFSGIKSSERKVPLMTDNLIYDMDSSSSPSSSDTDNPPKTTSQPPPFRTTDNLVPDGQAATKARCDTGQTKTPVSSAKQADQDKKSRPLSPLKEKSMNQTPESVPSFRPKHISSAGGDSRNRRRPPARSKDAYLQKRWV